MFTTWYQNIQLGTSGIKFYAHQNISWISIFKQTRSAIKTFWNVQRKCYLLKFWNRYFPNLNFWYIFLIMMEANYCTQYENVVYNPSDTNGDPFLIIDPTTIIFEVEFVKKWATNSPPSFFQILHICSILDTNFSTYFNKN